MKAGYVALIGRPNTGKSTLLNNILQQKVSVTSPLPQTTRFPIHAVYEDERGQIVFIDTPGIFGKVEDPVSKVINTKAEKALSEGGVDVVVYLVDHTRDRNFEENKILGMVRKIGKPKILAFNKSDIKEPDFYPHYRFMEEEFDRTIHISAMFRHNLNYLMDAIFEFLPEREKKIVDTKDRPTPLLNMDSKMYIADIIREKAYLFLRDEIPYTLMTKVEEVETRENGVVYIKASIITNQERYKKMIIGHKGYMIKEIGMATRKEMETATNKKVFVDITVEVNPHWTEELV